MNTLTKLETVNVQLEDGYPVFADGDDLAIAMIIARNGESHFAGIIKHTGFERGAFASTVAHDSHNLLVIGRDVPSMVTAAGAVYNMQGGVAIAEGESVMDTA